MLGFFPYVFFHLEAIFCNGRCVHAIWKTTNICCAGLQYFRRTRSGFTIDLIVLRQDISIHMIWYEYKIQDDLRLVPGYSTVGCYCAWIQHSVSCCSAWIQHFVVYHPKVFFDQGMLRWVFLTKVLLRKYASLGIPHEEIIRYFIRAQEIISMELELSWNYLGGSAHNQHWNNTETALNQHSTKHPSSTNSSQQTTTPQQQTNTQNSTQRYLTIGHDSTTSAHDNTTTAKHHSKQHPNSSWRHSNSSRNHHSNTPTLQRALK